MTDALAHLPHGPGFRFLDRALRVEPGARGTFEVRLAADHPILQAHFPGAPLVPGVVLIEALAQAAGCVWGAAEPGLQGVRLAEVSRARFRAPVGPGAAIRLDVEHVRTLGPLRRFAGTASVEGDVVAEAELTLVAER